jgi:hypothetical protein
VETFKGVVSDDDWRRLTVMVVPDEEVAAAVNAVAHQAGLEGRYRPREGDTAVAVTVPVDSPGGLECKIVLGLSLIAELSDSFRFPASTVLAVLEELLHVRIYSAAHGRAGRVQPTVDDDNACDVDLTTLARHACDEYVVGRTKAALVNQCPVAQRGPDSPLETLQISYDGSQALAGDAWLARIGAVVRESSSQRSAPAEAWPSVLGMIYRGFLEPLARMAAYRDALQQIETIDPENLSRPQVFQSRVPEIVANLQSVVQSDLAETEQAAQVIAAHLRAILADLGVTYIGDGGAACAIRFVNKADGE